MPRLTPVRPALIATAALLASALALTAQPAEAQSRPGDRHGIGPKAAQVAQHLANRAGLQAPKLQRRGGGHAGNTASVGQFGANNRADIHQDGNGNTVIVRQIGTGHSADVSQVNGGNFAFVLQVGNGTHVDVNQTGGQHGHYVSARR